jgi:inhibitor of cysteine peptidase
VDQQRNGNTFTVTITTLRPTDKMCAAMIVPYEKSYALNDVVGLKAGTYTVNVNGVSETFELTSDNKLP